MLSLVIFDLLLICSDPKTQINCSTRSATSLASVERPRRATTAMYTMTKTASQ